MKPTVRFLVLRQGCLVFTTNERRRLVAFLWGRDLKHGYVVYDYEQPYPWDDPDLLAWIVRIPD
jgi:hypothetical protein